LLFGAVALVSSGNVPPARGSVARDDECRADDSSDQTDQSTDAGATSADASSQGRSRADSWLPPTELSPGGVSDEAASPGDTTSQPPTPAARPTASSHFAGPSDSGQAAGPEEAVDDATAATASGRGWRGAASAALDATLERVVGIRNSTMKFGHSTVKWVVGSLGTTLSGWAASTIRDFDTESLEEFLGACEADTDPRQAKLDALFEAARVGDAAMLKEAVERYGRKDSRTVKDRRPGKIDSVEVGRIRLTADHPDRWRIAVAYGSGLSAKTDGEARSATAGGADDTWTRLTMRNLQPIQIQLPGIEFDLGTVVPTSETLDRVFGSDETQATVLGRSMGLMRRLSLAATYWATAKSGDPSV